MACDVGYGTSKDEYFDPNPEPICLGNVDDRKFLVEKRPGFLFDCVDMCIEEGSTTCILGPSNATLALFEILSKRLAPVEGTVNLAPGVRVGYCDSQVMRELVSRVGSKTKTTALEFLTQEFPQKSDQELRAHMTAFGLSPASQTKTPVCFLSGGETFRFVLAKIMVEEPPVLCLEHPTWNLDVESVQALAHGLREWSGTLILVCHDANFLRSLENVKCVVVIPEEGKIRRIVDDGGMYGMDAYLKTLQSSR